MDKELKVSEIKKIFEETDIKDIPSVREKFAKDERSGVINIVKKFGTLYDKYCKETERTYNMRKYEREYEKEGLIAGIDEVGRGPLAGPVVTCAVILPKDCNILYINDSKQLTEKKREELYDVIMREAVAVGIGIESPETIDSINILQATYSAMRTAIDDLGIRPDVLLNDAVTIPMVDIKQVPIIKGDAKSMSIAAASIIAKVTRDRMMVEFHKIYPEYDFAGNKGYGSKKHIDALKKYGPTPIHRHSFISGIMGEENL